MSKDENLQGITPQSKNEALDSDPPAKSPVEVKNNSLSSDSLAVKLKNILSNLDSLSSEEISNLFSRINSSSLTSLKEKELFKELLKSVKDNYPDDGFLGEISKFQDTSDRNFKRFSNLTSALSEGPVEVSFYEEDSEEDLEDVLSRNDTNDPMFKVGDSYSDSNDMELLSQLFSEDSDLYGEDDELLEEGYAKPDFNWELNTHSNRALSLYTLHTNPINREIQTTLRGVLDRFKPGSILVNHNAKINYLVVGVDPSIKVGAHEDCDLGFRLRVWSIPKEEPDKSDDNFEELAKTIEDLIFEEKDISLILKKFDGSEQKVIYSFILYLASNNRFVFKELLKKKYLFNKLSKVYLAHLIFGNTYVAKYLLNDLDFVNEVTRNLPNNGYLDLFQDVLMLTSTGGLSIVPPGEYGLLSELNSVSVSPQFNNSFTQGVCDLIDAADIFNTFQSKGYKLSSNPLSVSKGSPPYAEFSKRYGSGLSGSIEFSNFHYPTDVSLKIGRNLYSMLRVQDRLELLDFLNKTVPLNIT